jgi:hypothetical protein
MAGLFALCLGSVGALVWAAIWGLTPAKSAAVHEETAHAHRSGHGGQIEVVGDHHVEALLQKGGRLWVYTLGRQETELAPISAPALSAEAQVGEELDFVPFQLQAQPHPGEPAGQSSRFLGTLPPALIGRPMALTLTVPLGEKQYRVRFSFEEHARDDAPHSGGEEHAAGMPALPPGVEESGGSEAERELYQTPGGRYTAADIQVNGLQPPSVKFRGIFASHDMHPRPGDRLCPITSTLASPRFAWTADGKQYLFCCPPCIDEFVRLAKEKPELVRPPEAYVKR